MIPKEKIDEVRERTSIVRLIGEYIPLKKRGANWLGLCPFHSEKTPSFSVNEDKKIFYCFGCHETGSAITFLMKKDGMAFPEAVRELASKCGVTIKDERPGRSRHKDSLYNINRSARDYFVKTLNSGEGAGARKYLEKRGFKDKALLTLFGLGYAPKGWSGLLRFLEKAGCPAGLADKAGLVSKGEKGYYDRFRQRLIFPITDIRERVIGFGGRDLGVRGPKYLNSPETELFKKGDTLFGLSQAAPGIKEQCSAIVVEGYFDLLAMHAAGFTNTVATLGTALTKGHIRILRGYAERIYTLFDADEAGVKAALRSLELFIDEDLRCRVVSLVGAKDPDELLQTRGPEELKKALKSAIPILEFYLKRLESSLDISGPDGKAAFFEVALKYISRLGNVAERDHYASYVASRLQMPPTSVYEALQRGAAPRAGVKAVSRDAAQRGSIASLRGSTLVEFTVLKVILKRPDLYSSEVSEAVSFFMDKGLKNAGVIICGAMEQSGGPRIDEISEALQGAQIDGFIKTGLLRDDDGFIGDASIMLKDSLKKILNRGKLKKATKEMLGRLEDSGNTELAEEIKKRIWKKD